MIAETREAMLALTESEFADYLRSVIRELEHNPTTENCDLATNVIADLPPGPPRNQEEEDLRYALWDAMFAAYRKTRRAAKTQVPA